MDDQGHLLRDERGRLLPGHRLGRRPGKSVHPLASAFQRLGTSTEEVRVEVVSRMLQLAREGDLQALRFLAERLVPEGRPLDDVFEGVAPEPEARLAALVEHVGRGTLSPSEAEEVARIVKAHADAELWAKLRDRLAALEAKPVGAAAGTLVTVEPRIVDEIAAARAAAAGDAWDERLDR